MHFVVVSCGRVGAKLGVSLERMGHSVAMISKTSDNFDRLPSSFRGKKVVGFGFDRATLEEAGIQDAVALAAVTDSDNENIIAARVAREEYGVDNVIARIYDTARAPIYERMGIPTVATIQWTVDQVLRKVISVGATDEYRDPSSKISIVRADYDMSWTGQTIAEINRQLLCKVAFIDRFGSSFIVGDDDILQGGDQLYLLCESAKVNRIEHVLSASLVVEKSKA